MRGALQGDRRRLRRASGVVALVLAGTAFCTAAARAQNATWLTSPGGNDFDTGSNWSTGTVPTGTASFNTSNTTSLTFSTNTTIGGWTFNAGASNYTFSNSNNLAFIGSGILINGGSAAITNNQFIIFQNSATAGSATITNDIHGLIEFSGTSTAGNATIINNSGILFLVNSTGGNAAIVNNAAGYGLDFSAGSGPAGNNQLSVGSIAGAGTVYLGADQLTVGSNNLSTNVSGVISDCGPSGTACESPGASGGSLVKIGTGTLTLSGANTYSGGTVIDAGTLTFSGAGLLGATTGTTTINAGGVLDLGGTTQTQATVNLSGGTVQNGALDAPIDSAGGTINGIGGTASVTTTAGTTFVEGSNAYTGATAVNGGTLDVIGSITNSSSVTVNSGGTLTGTGTVDLATATIMSGGTFIPGTVGVPGTSMTIAGGLAFQSGALYVVYLNPSSTTFANVTGTAALAGTVDAMFAPGAYVGKQYTILESSGLGGTTFSGLAASGLPAGFDASLSYNTDDVLLNLTAALGAGTPLNPNQRSVANAINNFFNTGGALPPNFVNIFGLTGANLATALTQLDGEDATGAERGAFDLMNEFLGLMLDPFVYGRGGFTSGGQPLGFAPEEVASLPPEIALAYAGVLKAPPKSQTFEQRWTAWGSAFGGSNQTNGDPVVGSNNVTTSTYGYAAGMDYHVSPDTVFGFALAGGGTNWGLAQGLGSGRSDAFQAGVYGTTHFGPAYVAAALALSNNWFTTNRTALGDQLTANFVGQDYGARIEAGYRLAVPVYRGLVGLTPYAAIQAQHFHTPTYSETDLSGGGFGLSYAAMTGTDTRSELGARFDDPTLLGAMPIILRARLAWAHDWVSNPALNASFESLPGAGFTVNGAPIAKNSALTTAGAQLWFTTNWSFLAKFDGDFAKGSQTYAGSGTVRYSW
jgi:autotransporter-associated beta strand protein